MKKILLVSDAWAPQKNGVVTVLNKLHALLTERGYAVASIGYRLSDTAVFPAQLDDCRAAIVEIERNADVWGIDRDRVAVVGSGAGGHLAALVGLTSQPARHFGQAVTVDAVSR